MTATLKRALETLNRRRMYPDEMYPILFPLGQFNTHIDLGSNKGGPSRREYAVNNYLAKHARDYVRRELVSNNKGKPVAWGRYYLTELGKAKFREATA